MSSGSVWADQGNQDSQGNQNNQGNEDRGGGSMKAPEIDAGSGGHALALLVGGVLLAGERLRSSRKC